MIRKPTTIEKQKALSIFKAHYLGFNGIGFMPKLKINCDSKDFIVRNGIEKTCLIINNFPWVIKCDTYKNDSTKPCRTEAKNYQRAISYNLNEYFAPTYYIGKYDGVDIILQKKLIVDAEYTRSHAYETTGDEVFSPYTLKYGDRIISIYPSWNEECSLGQDNVLAALYNNYDLIYFCHKYEINDLHDGNFGWDGNQPYITDFSGYYASNTEDSYEY